MGNKPGWIGDLADLHRALIDVKADTDEAGAFLIRGQVCLGLGGIEIVISGDAQYSVEGELHNLAELMAGRDVGCFGIHVF